MNIRFALFEEKDAVGVSEIIVNELLAKKQKSRFKPDGRKIAKEYTPEEIVAQSEWRTIVVAHHVEDIVGTGAYAKIPRNNKNGEYWMLSVFVGGEYQGSKVGTRIVNHLENEVKKLDAKRMRVPVTAEDKSFYKKLGYVEIEKRKEWTDAGLCVMEKVFLDV